MVRYAFPDAIAGLYVPDELGAEVEIDETGEVRAVRSPVRICETPPRPTRT